MFKSKRTITNIGIFGSFILLPFLPWYILFVAGIVASWYFTYYEFIVLGFLMDMFFASSHMSLGDTELTLQTSLPYMSSAPTFIGTFFFTGITACIVFVLQLLKKRVRFYS